MNQQIEPFRFTLTSQQAGQRLDKLIQELLPELTRSAVQRLIEQGYITKNGKLLRKNEKGSNGDQILVTIPEPVPVDIVAEHIPLQIVYEDADLLVVNKPKGMVVHPAAGHFSGTLVNALLYHCGVSLSGINGVIRPGIVHRIDKDTSGLLIVAKNDVSHQHLAAQIKAHTFIRKYEAIVYGNLKTENGIINAPIGRHPTERKRMAVTAQNSKPAVTHYQVLARYRNFTYLRLTLETGRTHQIRVHMAHIGHPIAGDPVYGPKKILTALNGQCLHARVIGFVHPTTGQYLEFTTELPPYFTQFLSGLTPL